jgi:predicted nucleic acid-binding protein
VKTILLDAGPLGLAVHPRPVPGFREWLASLRATDATIVVPEIAHYELRRELLRIDQQGSIERLDRLIDACRYAPITTPVILRAAQLWAETRRRGRPTADDRALDGDVILAATALEMMDGGDDVVVATTNVGHISRFVPAALWGDITG